MARKTKFTREVLTRIELMNRKGVPIDEIAFRFGTTPGSIRVSCLKHGIEFSTRRSGTRRFLRVDLMLEEDLHKALDKRAKELGYMTSTLVSRLVEIITRDNMFEAVLDEQETVARVNGKD
jgi:hypothetical protein